MNGQSHEENGREMVEQKNGTARKTERKGWMERSNGKWYW